VTYMGESGSALLEHFSGLTDKLVTDQCNPADVCLSVLADMTPPEAQDAFKKSNHNAELLQSIESEIEKARGTAPPAIAKERPNHVLAEIWLLTKRQTIVQWRNPSYCFMRLTSVSIMSLFLAILFGGDKSQLEGAVFTIGAIFFLVFVLVIPMQATVVPLVEDRAVLYRETVSGCYSRLAYGIGQLLADQSFHLLNTLLMFLLFYFIVGFKVEGPEIGYFLVMIFFSNVIILSMGQLYALATPNEESANGLGGLSVMLSVILMGFLITVTAMPSGWTWAYHANLFHYIIQGLVTNELANSMYHLQLGKILEDVQMPDHIFVFDGGNSTQKKLLSNLLSLVTEIPDGTNPDSRKLPSLIGCTLTNKCFGDEDAGMAGGFIDCYLFSGLLSDPPCSTELNAVLETANATTIMGCFAEEDRAFVDITSPISVNVVPQFESSLTTESVSHAQRRLILGLSPDKPVTPGDDKSDLRLVLCLARAFLPPDALDEILETISNLLGVAGFVFDVVHEGINIPGELILAVFGWAEYTSGEGFVAPFKWYYCMFAVAVFLLIIEVFKLVAVQFIVWIKR